jgi:hypothetical protein
VVGAGLEPYIVMTSNVNGAEATNSPAQTINLCTFRDTFNYMF